jgi:hypothetical protein
MFSGQKQSLALALTEQGITAVVMGISARLGAPLGKRRTVLHAASLAFTADANLDHPQALGRELKLLLRQNGISSSRCAVGLAASYIASREKIVPTSDRESLRGALSIAAEREFPSGSGDLSFDYLASPCDAGLCALLVAAPRRIIAQVVLMAQAAGLAIEAITSSTAALALATRGAGSGPGANGHGQPGEPRMVLCLLDRQGELAVQSPHGLRLIRHLPIAMDSPGAKDALIGQLRRIIALSPQGQPANSATQVLLWNLAGGTLNSAESSVASDQRGEALKNSLSAQLNLDVRLCSMKADLDVDDGETHEQALGAPNGDAHATTTHGQDAHATPWGANLAQAAAVACAGTNGDRIDFLHSRLTPPKVRRIGRPALWAMAAAAIVVAALVYLFFDWQATQQEADNLEKQRNTLRPADDQARAFLANMDVASGWYDRRPEFLACMKEIASAFPDEGKVWATRLNIDEDTETAAELARTPNMKYDDPAKYKRMNDALNSMRVSLAGKGVSRGDVLAVLDRLRSNPQFTNVIPGPISQAGGVGATKDLISFEVNLTLQGAKQ